MDPRYRTVYQIWPRSFMDTNGDGIGDLLGITSKLDYIHELGVDTIWLSPIHPSPNHDYGYDVSDYYAINPEFGTMEDFDELVEKAGKRGIGIVMDLVPNHTSIEHEWFKQAVAQPDSPYRDFYYFKIGKNGAEPNNWMSFFGGSAWTLDKKSGEYYLSSFAPEQADLNWENPRLRQEMYSMMRFWLDKGVIGFRIDVVNLIKKAAGLPDKDPHKKGYQLPVGLQTGQKGVHDFMREMNEEVFSRYPNCFTVGEGCLVDMDELVEFTRRENRELSMMFHFELAMLGCGPLGKFDFRKLYHFTIRDFKRVTDYWQTQMQLRGGWVGNYLSNHDQPRQLSRFGCGDKPLRRQCAKALCLYNITLRGTPFIYQGEEVGMTDCPFTMADWRDYEAINGYEKLQSMMHIPKKLAQRIVSAHSRDNARTPMQWNGGRNAGFTSGTPWIKLNPNYHEINIEDDATHMDSVVGFYKRAIALRKEHPVLVEGEYAPIDADNPSVIAYTRSDSGESILVAINLSGKAAKVTLPRAKGAECLIFTHSSRHLEETLRLLPYEGLAYRLR